MKKLLLSILCLVLAACSDELAESSAPAPAVGSAMRFEATVIDQPQTRGTAIDVSDNTVTKDFRKGDSFGLFIVDADGNFVTEIDGYSARNIKLTTPDGKAWNLSSDIKEVVHKLGYKYVAYYPYSEAFDGCTSTDEIKALLTPPAADQSTQAATDWMYTEPTSPQTNAVTTLVFRHRYAKIDIYNSFTQEHTGSWTSAYQYTKTVDQNKVEHYRYILNAETPETLSVSGKYTIGNYLTGMKEMSYCYDDITIQNGRHAIVYTYGMDERCAVDLGFPSGVRWSPINLGTETATYMDEAQIAAVCNGTKLGKRLAWGELFEKDSYNYDTYINDPYMENASSLLPPDIAGTVYDPVTQYWGGHWSLPSKDDLQEFIDNTVIVGTETVHSDELDKDINRITFRSTRNGNTITMLTCGYANNASVVYNQYLYYMSASCYDYKYFMGLTNNSQMKTTTFNKYNGVNIRPVLKELYVYPYAEKKDIVVENIDDIAVDLGITKTVTESDGNGGTREVTYKVLWSPFNYGAEAKVELRETNHLRNLTDDEFIDNCKKKPGMRLAWGDKEERDENTRFTFEGYANSEMAQNPNYDKNNATSTDKDTRDLDRADDIVQLNWPEGWSIPTARDFELLVSNTSVTTEKDASNNTWFRLTATNGNSILIPGTWYIDSNYNKETWATSAYLQSSTMGTSSTSVTGNKTGATVTKRTIYALSISGTKASVANSAGRATGLMIRPVKYLRVE